jgi:hypothetical protein
MAPRAVLRPVVANRYIRRPQEPLKQNVKYDEHNSSPNVRKEPGGDFAKNS